MWQACLISYVKYYHHCYQYHHHNVQWGEKNALEKNQNIRKLVRLWNNRSYNIYKMSRHCTCDKIDKTSTFINVVVLSDKLS